MGVRGLRWIAAGLVVAAVLIARGSFEFSWRAYLAVTVGCAAVAVGQYIGSKVKEHTHA